MDITDHLYDRLSEDDVKAIVTGKRNIMKEKLMNYFKNS